MRKLLLSLREQFRGPCVAQSDNSEWKINYKYELDALHEDMNIITIKTVGWNWLVMLLNWKCNDTRIEFLMPKQKADERQEGLDWEGKMECISILKHWEELEKT
jgi:hypothetical protein